MASPHPAPGMHPRPILLFTLLVAALVLLGFGLDQRAALREALHPARSATIGFDGRHYRISHSELPLFIDWSSEHFAGHAAAGRELLREDLERSLTALFDDVAGAIPEFADWYFSVRGEYARLAAWAVGAAGLRDADFLSQQLHRTLFEATSFDQQLQDLERRQQLQLADATQTASLQWLSELEQRLSSSSPSLPVLTAPELSLDGLQEQLLTAETTFAARIRTSSAIAGTAALAPVLWRGAGRVAAGAAARTGARASTTAGGASACLATGPAAPGCALLVATVSWLATDWLLLAIDEARHRPGLEAELSAGLEQLREQVLVELFDHYEQMLVSHYQAQFSAIERSFVPLRDWRKTDS